MSLTKLFVITTLIISLGSCETEHEKGKRLAEQYCGSCHAFPNPNLLPKTIWAQNVLPNMAFRMGLTDLMELPRYVPGNDILIVAATLPSEPMVSPSEWQAIVDYFLDSAPDSLSNRSKKEMSQANLFVPIKYKQPDGDGSLPLVTQLYFDSPTKRIIVGTRTGELFQVDNQFQRISMLNFTSTSSHVLRTKNHHLVSLMGIMDPNDQPKGELIRIDSANRVESIIDSLKRPVYFELADLNNDQQEDIIICEFGNYTGSLSAYEKIGKKYKRHLISVLPGSRRTVIKDFNGDGLNDILCMFTQGDEQITLLVNEGNFKFYRKNILRFPPVYGSTYFDIADFNNDGRFDIIYTNGDNSDYSQILKPYHGIRIFLQNENEEFEESWFYPIHGISKAIPIDFDLDGDLDIATISFFPDFKNNPEASFVYFNNQDGKFAAQQIPQSVSGRWIVMEAADIGGDGDVDLFLGALDFQSKVPDYLFQQWKGDKTCVLILQNQTH